MQVVANYDPQEAPTVSGPPPGYKPPDLSRISPKEQERRARERGFGSLENSGRDRWGRTIAAGAGGLLGLAAGGPGAALTLGSVGYRVGDNAARGIANLRRPPIGVEPITPPVETPILQANTGGIFGQGMRGLARKAQGVLAAVASGKMSVSAASAASGLSESRIRDSLGSMGSGGSGGMGQSWGGSYGGFYGGSPSGYASGGFHGGAYNPNR